MKYPKINTIWKRDASNKGRIIEGEYSKEEFQNIKYYLITEKVDGTNIRITRDEGKVTFGGRTDNAQIPTFLYTYMQKTFTPDLLTSIFGDAEKLILFNEGYGQKIQKGGGKYRKECACILFDVWIDGWWLAQEAVTDIAERLGIDRVPIIGIMTIQEAIEFVKCKTQSIIAEEPKVMEGIVARSQPLMLFRNGDPVIWKLKVRDYF